MKWRRVTLAQARHHLELSSIVELSQAQLQRTITEIGNTNARYQYRVALATLNYLAIINYLATLNYLAIINY